jgi:hypothetical protein
MAVYRWLSQINDFTKIETCHHYPNFLKQFKAIKNVDLRMQNEKSVFVNYDLISNASQARRAASCSAFFLFQPPPLLTASPLTET